MSRPRRCPGELVEGGIRVAPALTAAGRATVERLIAAWRKRLADLFDGWSPEEYAELT